MFSTRMQNYFNRTFNIKNKNSEKIIFGTDEI